MIRWNDKIGKSRIMGVGCSSSVRSEKSSQVGAFKSILKPLGSATRARRLSRLITAESSSKEVDAPFNSYGLYI